MHTLFEIASATGTYSVECAMDAIEVCAASMQSGVVLADEIFAARLSRVGVSAIVVQGNEVSKSMEGVADVIVRVREKGATRTTHLWAIGGGSVQDVAGFVASIYMRGLEWTYIPTTLLGMVDSCLGGKSSINVGGYKNIVGTFHAPAAIIIDPTLTGSLSTEQLVGGLVEAAKICYCRGEDVFADYLALQPNPAMSTEEFESIIALSLGAKKWFCEVDEFDRGERLLLNLGHTFGHALEGASTYQLSHGMAVGVGILCALSLSGELVDAPQHPAQLLNSHIRYLLGLVAHLPPILRDIDVNAAFLRLIADKKHGTDNFRFVILDGAGRARVVALPRDAETELRAVNAMRQTLESLQ